MNKTFAASLNEQYIGYAEEELLRVFVEKYHGKIALASSLSPEDQILTHILMKIDPQIRIFTLDTGRLFSETYDLIARTNARYKTKIEIFFPEHSDVEEMVNSKGINLFYDSVENRRICCRIRKVEPLKRAFEGLDAWICGLRREQSETRTHLSRIEWDDENNMLKISPLIDWSREQVWKYIQDHHIPYNPLNDKGFLSIGCQPCTRAVEEGENERAGRWWWENPGSRECGLHRKHWDQENC
jgi:phosphoadenosine phosphosulfate reductase